MQRRQRRATRSSGEEKERDPAADTGPPEHTPWHRLVVVEPRRAKRCPNPELKAAVTRACLF